MVRHHYVNMIPKQLFFIWFGDNKPDYVDNNIKQFKKINFDYNIDLIFEKNPFNSSNEDIKDCLNLLKDPNNYLYKIYNRNWAVNNLKSNIGKIVKFSDCFRFYILNKYKGIYLDCDTYPVCKFDDLINLKSFTCLNIKNNKKLDIFFIGNSNNNILVFPENFNNENTIDIIDFNIYIKHLNKKSWKYDT